MSIDELKKNYQKKFRMKSNKKSKSYENDKRAIIQALKSFKAKYPCGDIYTEDIPCRCCGESKTINILSYVDQMW